MFDFLTAADFFISYSRRDIGASEYAISLATELRKHHHSSYIDQYGSEAGQSIPPSLMRKLKRSKILIVLVGQYSCESLSVQEEVTVFASTGRVILPIDFYGVEKAIWYNCIAGIAVSKLAPENFGYSPTEAVIARIIGSFRYTSQLKRIRRSMIMALVLFAAAILAMTFLGLQIATQKSRLTELDENLATTLQMNKTADSLFKLKSERLGVAEDSVKLMEASINVQKRTLSKLADSLGRSNALFYNRDEYLIKLNGMMFDSAMRGVGRPPDLNPAEVLIEIPEFVFEMGRATLRTSELKSEKGKMLDAFLASSCKEYERLTILVVVYFGLERWEATTGMISPDDYQKMGIQRFESVKKYIISTVNKYEPGYEKNIHFRRHLIFNGGRSAGVIITR
jgi:hypothetical protein